MCSHGSVSCTVITNKSVTVTFLLNTGKTSPKRKHRDNSNGMNEKQEKKTIYIHNLGIRIKYITYIWTEYKQIKYTKLSSKLIHSNITKNKKIPNSTNVIRMIKNHHQTWWMKTKLFIRKCRDFVMDYELDIASQLIIQKKSYILLKSNKGN